MSFLTCLRCTAQNPPNARFCLHCGSPFHKPVAAQAAQEPNSSGYSTWATVAIVGIILFVCVMLVIGILVIEKKNSDVAFRKDLASPTPYPRTYSTPLIPPEGITMENYLRIQDGMTYAEVVGILGKSGTEMSRNNIAGYETVMYEWRGRGIGGMNAIFQNGRLMQKAQFGLK